MSEYKHGEMNTFSQQKTFENFVKLVSRAMVVIVCVLIFMAIVGG